MEWSEGGKWDNCNSIINKYILKKEWLEDKGQVLNIQMRRTLHKAFKGSVFAVLDSIESAKKFVETPRQKYKDIDLLILFKEDYFAKKKRRRRRRKKAK